MRAIARVHSDFPSKFGVPRQSGLVEDLTSTLVFEPEFRSEDALRGLEGFSHLWLVWVFHQAARGEACPPDSQITYKMSHREVVVVVVGQQCPPF